ncbi:MAG: hypothetical protein AAFN00_05160 [Cyanobacteria bacterium J06558_2]
MSLGTCGDLCTAAKCQELENRIASLERLVSIHLGQSIPEAHDITPVLITNLTDGVLYLEIGLGGKVDSASVQLPETVLTKFEIEGQVNEGTLNLDAFINDLKASAIIELPQIEEIKFDSIIEENLLKLSVDIDGTVGETEINLEEVKTFVTLDIFDQGNGDYVFKVGVNNDFDEDTLKLSESNLFETNLTGSASFQNDTLTISIADGKSEDSFETNIPISELKETDKDSNLKINGSYRNEDLSITVSDGNSSDSFSVSIPRGSSGGGGQPEPSSLSGAATYEENILKITVSNGSSTAVFQVEIMTIDEELIKKIEKMYEILGGDNWEEGKNGEVSMEVNPESLINTTGKALYEEESSKVNNVKVSSLLELITAYSAVDFYRSGHHRLPIRTLQSLLNTEGGNQEIKIYDAISFQEWLVKQIDALVGEFPLKLNFKTTDAENKEVETEICLENISEALAEFLPLILGTAEDTDLLIQIGMKNLIENSKGTNTSARIYDYVVANAAFLGYRGNEVEREIDLTFTPKSANMTSAMKSSKGKYVGWEMEDKDTLIETVKRTLIATEIVKAALFIPFTPGDSITGDAIKETEQKDSETNDEKWEQFKTRVNHPSGRYEVPKPASKIKDLTIDKDGD